MSHGQPPRGKTGEKVREPGTYKCEDETRWTYVAGDEFRACPTTGKATVWEKTSEPEHADSR